MTKRGGMRFRIIPMVVSFPNLSLPSPWLIHHKWFFPLLTGCIYCIHSANVRRAHQWCHFVNESIEKKVHIGFDCGRGNKKDLNWIWFPKLCEFFFCIYMLYGRKDLGVLANMVTAFLSCVHAMFFLRTLQVRLSIPKYFLVLLLCFIWPLVL